MLHLFLHIYHRLSFAFLSLYHSLYTYRLPICTMWQCMCLCSVCHSVFVSLYDMCLYRYCMCLCVTELNSWYPVPVCLCVPVKDYNVCFSLTVSFYHPRRIPETEIINVLFFSPVYHLLSWRLSSIRYLVCTVSWYSRVPLCHRFWCVTSHIWTSTIVCLCVWMCHSMCLSTVCVTVSMCLLVLFSSWPKQCCCLFLHQLPSELKCLPAVHPLNTGLGTFP